MRRSLDRAAGTLLGGACGDALGAGYEFGPGLDHDPTMKGGGAFGWEPGEWTDDTQMAICIAEVAATGELDVEAIGDGFLEWFRSGPTDVGISTRAVLRGASAGTDLPASAARYFAANPDGAAGNGSLMRTAPVALATLDHDHDTVAAAARAVSDVTHADPLAADACVLWCIGIQDAIEDGSFDGVRHGLACLPSDRRRRWAAWLDEAETTPPESFTGNGYVVRALQAAYASIVQTPVPDDRPPCLHFQHALNTAVRIGGDTDTVGAIAGALLGARWGASAVPFVWRRKLHGWPGYRARDIVRLAVLSAGAGRPDRHGWPTVDRMPTEGGRAWTSLLPGDDGVVLGTLAALDVGELDVDVVVSLCRVGAAQVPGTVEHHEVWLADRAEPDANPNLAFVLEDAAAAVGALRAEGKRVLLHCVGGRSRTPTVAALYLANREGIPATAALDRVAAAIPEYSPHNTAFRRILAARHDDTAG